MGVPVWDDVATDILKTMHAEGASAGFISKTLMEKGYSYSRNAVIGRKNRLGLPPPPADVLKQRVVVAGKHAAKPKLFVYRKPQPLGAQVSEVEMLMKAPGSNAVPLLESKDGQCKAIIRYEDGDLAKAIYCGDPTPIKFVKGRISHNAWCSYHHGVYTQADRPHHKPAYRTHR